MEWLGIIGLVGVLGLLWDINVHLRTIAEQATYTARWLENTDKKLETMRGLLSEQLMVAQYPPEK